MKIVYDKCHDRLFPLVLGACLVFMGSSTAIGDDVSLNRTAQNSEQNASAVTVEYSDIDNTTIYSISSKDCAIEWIVRNSEIGVIKHRAQCSAVPLSHQLPLLTMICTEFYCKDKNSTSFRTLFWGRLIPDERNPALQELSLRIAVAAHKSPGWDAKRGKPKKGDINAFVRDLANTEMIYPELKELFERFHKRITFTCAEKVLVSEAGKLPFFDQLKQRGVNASDRLPFDCMTWFSVSAQ